MYSMLMFRTAQAALIKGKSLFQNVNISGCPDRGLTVPQKVTYSLPTTPTCAGLGQVVYLVKMSNSKTEMWSLTVRSMVDFRAMASKEECMGWASFRVILKSRHGTIAL